MPSFVFASFEIQCQSKKYNDYIESLASIEEIKAANFICTPAVFYANQPSAGTQRNFTRS